MAGESKAGRVKPTSGFFTEKNLKRNRKMSREQSIAQTLSQMTDSNGRMILQATSQGTSALIKAPPAVTDLICQYKEPTKLLATFNPQQQVNFTLDKRRAYLGKAPSLGLVGKAFAFGTAKSWAAIQLWDLAEFSGCKTKLSENQIDELAKIICVDYGYMKLTELMDFFRRFKSGEYGKFYGAVDPMVITCALREFAADRRTILARFEREDAELRRRNDPREIARDRAIKREARMKKFYSYNFRSRDFTIEEFEEIWWLFNLGYERKNHGYHEED